MNELKDYVAAEIVGGPIDGRCVALTPAHKPAVMLVRLPLSPDVAPTATDRAPVILGRGDARLLHDIGTTLETATAKLELGPSGLIIRWPHEHAWALFPGRQQPIYPPAPAKAEQP